MSGDSGAFARARRGRDTGRRKSEILDVAEDIFRKKGFRLATTEEIARESGFSVGTLYNLFGDKERLYGEVLEGIGHRLFARIESAALSRRDPEEAVETLIRLRLCNYLQDRLFFQPFLSDGNSGIQSDVQHLSPHVSALHERYFGTVVGLFKRAISQRRLQGLNPVHLALSLEGMINAFMGYWSKPEQSDAQAHTAKHIKNMLLNPMAQTGTGPADAPDMTEPREVYISRFDVDRLKELILVARRFGKSDGRSSLDDLDRELTCAKVVSPKEVPADLITMNSVVRFTNVATGTSQVSHLVFPKDAKSGMETVSILDPLGTAMLGYRVGNVFVARVHDGMMRYRVEEILYQPEAAGDYHL